MICDPFGRLQMLLDELESWPCKYMFKFITPRRTVDDVVALFGGHPVRFRNSSQGNYVGVTAEMLMQNSSDVIAIYRGAAAIKGVISL